MKGLEWIDDESFIRKWLSDGDLKELRKEIFRLRAENEALREENKLLKFLKKDLENEDTDLLDHLAEEYK